MKPTNEELMSTKKTMFIEHQKQVIRFMFLRRNRISHYLYSMDRITSHLIFWLCFLLWSSAIMEWHNFSAECPTTYFGNVKHIASRLPILITATYLLVYKILPKYLFEQKSAWKFAFYFAILLLLTTVVDRSFIAFVESNALQIEGAFKCSFLNIHAIIRNSLILAAVMGMAFVIRFYRIHLANEEHQHSLIQNNLSNELSFLKAQVSPHFLFNALNNIYSDSIRKNEHETASSIEYLSGIMRYLTYDSNTRYVSLSKEINLIKNYIEVERMRISTTDEVSISFVAESNFSKYNIIPVLLLPLVENTFKHGIIPDQTCYIHISMKMLDDVLLFETRNSNVSRFSNKDGVGLNNVRERLSLLYKDCHSLDIKDGPIDYTLSLKLNLSCEF